MLTAYTEKASPLYLGAALAPRHSFERPSALTHLAPKYGDRHGI